MPDSMSDTLKWVIAATLLGGSNIATNAGQFLSTTRPAVENSAEAASNNDRMRDDLSACMTELRLCYKDLGRCAGTAAIDKIENETRIKAGEPFDWERANENRAMLSPATESIEVE